MKVKDISIIIIHIVLVLMLFSIQYLPLEIKDNEFYKVLWCIDLTYLLLFTIGFSWFCLDKIFTNNKVIGFFNLDINFKFKKATNLETNDQIKQDIKSEFGITIK